MDAFWFVLMFAIAFAVLAALGGGPGQERMFPR